MNWADWCDSEYNTDGFLIDQFGSEDLAVFNEEHTYVVSSNPTLQIDVGPHDTILNNGTYYGRRIDGGGGNN